MRFLECVDLNPKITITKGQIYPFVEMANVNTCYRSPDNVDEKPFDSGVKFQDGDTVIARISPCLQNGKSFYCQNIGTGFGSTEYLVFRPKDDSVDSMYLYYFMMTDFIKLSMINSMTGATGRQRVNNDVFNDIEVCFPNIDIQRKIGEILSAYDNLIENNQKQIKLLEEAAQRLYKEWFVDLHFPGYEDVKIVAGVPEGWKYKRVDEFGEVITGKTPSTSKSEYYGGSIPFVTIPDMHGKVFPLVTEKTLTKTGADTQKNKYLPINSVIVSCIATVGLVNIAVEPCQTNQQINSVILYDDSNLYFFYESMKRIKTLLDGVGSNGATMTNVNKTKFSNISVLYPTEDLVKRYNAFCKPIFNKILGLSKGILVSKQARDRLLPKLMSGEIEV
ncbi:restriction endonuclease subunit S [uncultured Megasphaera sp.]|uniref:restriction endonuclease subunit S n=1 Tax=uncultured Megasphaera sp. TaxID=165188 RepID=UPI0025947D7E|nr:restriction endonuclease subunit S [uncultured Megasphaera sp.]